MAQLDSRIEDGIKKGAKRDRRISFEQSADPFYSESNIRHLEIIMRDVKDGKAHFAKHELIEAE